MKKLALLFSATSMFLATAVPASAATLLFSFTPSTTGAQRFSFNVDSNPTVFGTTASQFSTNVQNLIVGGVAQTGIRSFTFYATGLDGGLESNVTGGYLGPQLFTGATTAPTLRVGSFGLFDGPNGASGTLSISTVVAAIPEPGTWAMMVLGFGLAGAAIRRRSIAMRVTYGARLS